MKMTTALLFIGFFTCKWEGYATSRPHYLFKQAPLKKVFKEIRNKAAFYSCMMKRYYLI